MSGKAGGQGLDEDEIGKDGLKRHGTCRVEWTTSLDSGDTLGSHLTARCMNLKRHGWDM